MEPYYKDADTPPEPDGSPISDILDLGLSTRVYNCLKNGGIETVAQLVTWSAGDLLQLREFGKGSLADVQAALLREGFEMLPPHHDVSDTRAMEDIRRIAAYCKANIQRIEESLSRLNALLSRIETRLSS